MNRHDALLKKIKAKAKLDERNRCDHRYLKVLGFLVAKGFLRTNKTLPHGANVCIAIDDAIWVGRHVEPRVLEVLPAAVLRLGKHFDLDPAKHQELALVVNQLRRRCPEGNPFCEIPYNKLKSWSDLPLKDGRVKPTSEKRLMKTFRLKPASAAVLRALAKKRNCTETEILDNLLKIKRSVS